VVAIVKTSSSSFFHHQTPPLSFHFQIRTREKTESTAISPGSKATQEGKEGTPYIQQQERSKHQGRRTKSIITIIMLPHLKIARVLRTCDLALQKFILMKCHLLQAEGEDQQAYQDDVVAACIGFNTQAHLSALLQHVIFLEVQLTGRGHLSPTPHMHLTTRTPHTQQHTPQYVRHSHLISRTHPSNLPTLRDKTTT